MTRRNVGLSALMVGCALMLAGGMASAEDLPPLPPVPPEYGYARHNKGEESVMLSPPCWHCCSCSALG